MTSTSPWIEGSWFNLCFTRINGLQLPTPSVAGGPKVSNPLQDPLCRKIQVTDLDVVSLDRTTRGPATFTPRSAGLLASQRVLEPCAWLCELPISGWASNVYFPAQYHKSVVTRRPFFLIRTLYTPLIHIILPAMNAGRCGVMNWDARMVTAGNPGSSCRF